MNELQDWPARLSPPQRNNFFFGKMMGVAQFEREQRYGMGQRWLMNRLTIGTGVLCGLEVTPTADGKRLRIAPGIAVDPWGREIVVACPVNYDPFAVAGGGCGDGAPITEAKDYMLCLTYRECAANDQPVLYADDCPGQPDCQPDTTVETFGLGLSAVETPKPFDCGAWTAAVSAPADTPGLIRPIEDLGEPGGVAPPARPPVGDLTHPGRPAPTAASSPPSIAVLRARLAEQFGMSCAAPGMACVPLALVTAKKVGDQWSLTTSEGVRRKIYTQAQLLEMILCLAECCGRETPPHDTVPETPSLRVTDLLVGAAAGQATGNVAQLIVGLERLTGAASRYVLPVGRPVALAVAFNHAVDTRTLVLPTAPGSTRSVSLTRSDPATGQDLTIPLMVAVLHLEPTTLLLFPAGETGSSPAGGTTGGFLRAGGLAFTLAAGSSTLPGGSYTLLLSGSSDPPGTTGARVPIKSESSATRAATVLDGEYGGTFPSGAGGEGGDFIYQFELVEVPQLKRLVSINGAEPTPSWTWSGSPVTVVLEFNVKLDPASIAAGVVLDAIGTQIGANPTITLVSDTQVQAVFTVAQPTAPLDPSNAIRIKFPKGTLRSAEGPTSDQDAEIQIAISS